MSFTGPQERDSVTVGSRKTLGLRFIEAARRKDAASEGCCKVFVR